MNNKNLFPLERNRYFHGKMLTARDFETEQRYFNDKRRLVNRCLFGAGVVCGLGVYLNDDTSLSVETGLALDYAGREIVVSSPVIRKLQMIDGFEALAGKEQAWLCLAYGEQPKEAVNNIGAPDSESRQFNKVEEGYRLFVDTGEPDADVLFGDGGRNGVQRLYTGRGLSLYLIVPAVSLSDQALALRMILVKCAGLPPVSFTLSFRSDYLRQGDSDSISLSFQEDRNAGRDIHFLDFELQAAAVADMQVPFCKGAAALALRMGDFADRADLPLRPMVHLCGSEAAYRQMMDIQMSSLERRMGGDDTPVYLAKIDYASAGSTHVLRRVTSLPFGQRVSGIDGGTGSQSPTAGAAGGSFGEVTSEVSMLKYWQKPEVTVRNNPARKSLHFHFGVPSTEAYDYATSSGEVNVPLTGAIRVNGRYASEEVPHNLGIGNVSLSFAVDFGSGEARRLLFGNGDVFNSKTEGKEVPRVEVAGILYPDAGTFRIGVRCFDHVEGHFLKVRWFAYKVTRDTADLRSRDLVSVKITPEIHKLRVRERVHFRALVTGTEDKGVVWNVKDAEGGKIDQSGLYQAPSKPGTYEIVATSTLDPAAEASSFLIVEE